MKQYYRYRSNKKNTSGSENKGWRKYVTATLIFAVFLVSILYIAPQYFGNIAPAGWKEPFRLGLDLQGGTHLIYEADMSSIPSSGKEDALSGVKDVIERRVNAFGVSEPVVQTTTSGDKYRLIIELAGVLDVKEAIKMIGETPILEFKEPSNELDREPTEEEKQTLADLQAEESKLANDVLRRARAGEDFAALAKEFSIDERTKENGGSLGLITDKAGVFDEIAIEIRDKGYWPGQVLPKTIGTFQGTNIVKYDKSEQSKEMELQHLLICFEGKLRCDNPIPALDASLIINRLKGEVTPENFADLVKENSTEPNASEKAGELGWIGPGVTVPAFEVAALSTPMGGFSEVVETEFGFHIIYKKAEKPITAYSVSRILLKASQITDVAPPASPWKNTELSGKHLTSAAVEFDQTTGTPYVSIKFNSDGDTLFGNLTERLINQQIGIFLDGEEISAPVVRQAIYGGSAVIEGDFTVDEAKLLARRLNAGALPVPINLLSEQTVGPTLGKISLEKSLQAGIIGLILVMLFMIAYYRLPGILAAVALCIYVVLNIALYKLFGVTVTLAGVAGLVLSIGMAVDANVLIFERLKEELSAGRDLRSAIDEAFVRAWTSIRDGNFTTLIATFILYTFSASFIKGFALTLSIGVLLSMLSAVLVTRVFLQIVSSLRFLKNKSLYAKIKNYES